MTKRRRDALLNCPLIASEIAGVVMLPCVTISSLPLVVQHVGVEPHVLLAELRVSAQFRFLLERIPWKRRIEHFDCNVSSRSFETTSQQVSILVQDVFGSQPFQVV